MEVICSTLNRLSPEDNLLSHDEFGILLNDVLQYHLVPRFYDRVLRPTKVSLLCVFYESSPPGVPHLFKKYEYF